jgi:hypothetical protein
MTSYAFSNRARTLVCERGSVFVSTRNKGTALKPVGHDNVVVVEPMVEAGAVMLVETILGACGDKDNVVGLAAALKYIPLAMVQGTSISQRAPGCW